MKEYIKEHLSHNKTHFYLTGMLSQITGQLAGHINSMRDENLNSLDKKYFAEKIEVINNKLSEFREFLYEQEMLTIEVNPEKIN